MIATKKEIDKKISKNCAICGRNINVIVYRDKSYRGGHFFGDIPLCTDREFNKSLKTGSHQTKVGEFIFNVLNQDPKPYAYEEYWECPKCYWRG